MAFLSTLSLRRATAKYTNLPNKISISIHALLAESDSQQPDGTTRTTYFYPRSPCGERQSPEPETTPSEYFYPRSPCGERRYWPCVYVVGRAISIHALLAESDVFLLSALLPWAVFLSTLSLRRATANDTDNATGKQISIHALLAESDNQSGHFRCELFRFLSTLSLRRATFLQRDIHPWLRFLSTLSLRRATVSYQYLSQDFWDFYPRSPCGERLAGPSGPAFLYNFYPRSPCGERRVTVLGIQHKVGISIHALLAESDFGRAFWPGLSL